MSIPTGRVLTALLALGLAVSAVACGDDDDSGGGDPSGTGSGSGGDFCDEFRAVAEDLSGLGDVEDPSDFAGVYQELSGAISEIDPPEDIADDWDRLDEAVAQVADALEGASAEEIQSGQAFAAIEEEFSDFEEVGERIDTFTEEECGFTVDSVDEPEEDGTEDEGTEDEGTG